MEEKKKKILITILIIILFSLIMGGLFLTLNKKQAKKENNVEQEPEQYESAYKISSNGLEDFDLHFLQLENEALNKIYSPLSIKYALAMLNEGSGGNTKAQIESIIGNYQPKKYPNNQNMSFANAMFIRNSYKQNVKPEYIDNLYNQYNAQVIYDSFENTNQLNNFVANKTFGLIDHLLDDISSNDFLLVNALAINMEWKNLIQARIDGKILNTFGVNYKHEKFSMYISPINDGYASIEFGDTMKNAKAVEIGAAINKYDIINTLGEENIRKEVGQAYDKWLAEGGCGENDLDTATYLDSYIKDLNSNYKQIDSSTDFLFYDDESVKAFAKDLKEYDGTTLQYVGIMPKNIELSDYIKEVSAKKVNEIISNLKDITLENFKEGVITKITGHIPLFNFEYELKLKEDLQKLGITNVFDEKKSDLTNMTNDKAYINQAVHRANIEFSNEGIKAAAATTMGGMGSAGCWFVYDYDVPVETIDLTFNKPYLFLIRDKNTGEVWFMGTVYSPSINDEK